ncbi:hypothetical protein Calab_1465 [Caldithrix abyssi DSM 13497]|uniref:Uncharacterized protein n=1 Tax=Caldithrix abyssi DSM 13497 TaxID=880073 RepID=H1XPW0_CALAY|nr:hypothetical protein [Caldithrix abyssi]APF20385.1 hypothetical protein Cabys_3639 [Caldithrix abyssi DSM 13497]EHO41086.1 hypothetical protein Calab_1465 [Caldithrix abyssi DSM 13497]
MNSLFKYAVYQNKWLWFHILGGGILAKLALAIFKNGQIAMEIVLLVAVLWEIFEYFKDDVEKIYGSKKRFFLDALGDIAGAALMAFIIIV